MVTNIDLTPVVETVIMLICAVITVFVIPKIKASLNKDQQDMLNYWVKVAVMAVEEQARSGKILKSEKFEKAKEILKEQGFDIDDEKIAALIDSSVWDLINQFKEEKANTDNKIEDIQSVGISD